MAYDTTTITATSKCTIQCKNYSVECQQHLGHKVNSVKIRFQKRSYMNVSGSYKTLWGPG